MSPRPPAGRRGKARIGVADSAAFNPLQIASLGRRVYERHRIAFERRHRGQYALIDTRTEKVFIADSPEAAHRQAQAQKMEGPFYLVRVGERAAFRSRRLSNGDPARVAR
jgi:hypothetical protein